MPSPRPIPDRDARDLIRERLDQNLVVEAGAGSGKTECLAQRMAAGVLAGRYAVEEMAAVTFTRKAAAELRGRFQLTLERALASAGDPATRERARAALAGLERLFAGTIHAFCAHLLRERPVEAGVAPGFTELDETADLQQRRRAWRDHLDRQRAAGSPLLQELIDTGVTPANLDAAFGIVCNYPEVDFPPGDGAVPDVQPARRALEAFRAQIERLAPLPARRDQDDDLQRRMREFGGRLAVSDLSSPRALAELLGMWEKPPKKGARGPALEALLAGFREATVRPFLARWRQHVYHVSVRLLLEAREHAARMRRQALTLTYGDLLQHAAALLRDNLEVRGALQQKYRWLFVDEFQDTDPIQAEVILLLAAEAGAEGDWTMVPLRPGALFIVGDPKQSIYRFRRADIDTYLRVRERIEATGGEVVELTASFRSVPALCHWANRAFRRLLPAEATPQQPAFHPLEPVRDEPADSPTGVRTLVAAAASGKVDDVAQADARAIARFIRGEVEAGRRRPGDFLCLTRTKKDLTTYAGALEAERLPVEVSGGAAFAESRSVTALASLLETLGDPDNGPAVVGVLRGPLFGLADPALFAHRERGHGFLITAPGLDDVPGPVGEALRALREMYGWTRTLPAPAAVERILEATGLLALAAATSPAGAEAGDLLHAVDRVRQVVEDGGTLADAAAALVEDLGSTEVESVPLEPGRTDVVRLMNLHKAKGLEAPVVFLANPQRGGMRRVDVRVARDGLRAVGHFRIIRRWGDYGFTVLGEPAGWADLEREELAYVDAEQHRLLYVAATRARDLLVVSRPPGRGKMGPWEPLGPDLAGAPAVVIPPPRVTVPPPLPDLGPEARAAARTAIEARRGALGVPSWRVESVTGTTHRAGPCGHPLQEGLTREPDTGIAWGSLIHFLLEWAMRGPRRDRVHLERLARWFAFDKPELRRVIPEALDTVEGVMAADFWREATASPERHVEVPFAVRVDGEGDVPTVLHGVIDLAYRTPEGWDVLDHKTDQLPARAEEVPARIEALVARYGPQVRAYGAHWSRLAGAPARAGLHFVRAAETRWVEG